METVRTEDAPRPIGPYSQATIYKDLIFLSGQVASNPKTGLIEGASIEAQTEQVMKNLMAVLTAAGSSLSNALKCTIFLADMNDFGAFNNVYATFFGENPPARSTVQAARLPRDAKVEIDVIAFKQED
jgi:2-iminobutanoate/2-iminopropanoate deaminase